MVKKEKKKSEPSRSQRHPIIDMIGNVPIRKVNYISVFVSEREMREIAKVLLKIKGTSAAKIIAFSAKPCDCCKKNKVIITDGINVATVKRGILYANRENRSNITTKKRKYNECTPGKDTPVTKNN